MVDTQYLETLISDSGLKRTYLADKCGLTRQAFWKKCNGQTQFTANEVKALCDELGVRIPKDMANIFFAK